MLTSRDDQVDTQSHNKIVQNTDDHTSDVDYRCKCGKLLFRGALQKGTISVKCRRCRNINTFFGSLDNTLPDIHLALDAQSE